MNGIVRDGKSAWAYIDGVEYNAIVDPHTGIVTVTTPVEKPIKIKRLKASLQYAIVYIARRPKKARNVITYTVDYGS